MPNTHQSHQMVQVKLFWLGKESQQELVLWLELVHLQNKFLSRSSIKNHILCRVWGAHWEGHKMDTQGEKGQKSTLSDCKITNLYMWVSESRLHCSDRWWFYCHHHSSCRSPGNLCCKVHCTWFCWRNGHRLALYNHLNSQVFIVKLQMIEHLVCGLKCQTSCHNETQLISFRHLSIYAEMTKDIIIYVITIGPHKLQEWRPNPPCYFTCMSTLKGCPVPTNSTSGKPSTIPGDSSMLLLMFQPAEGGAVPLVHVSVWTTEFQSQWAG